MEDAPKSIAGSTFIALGEDAIRAFSSDGINWSTPLTGKDGEVLSVAAFGAGRCVAAGRFGGMNHMYATADGVAWAPSEHDARYTNFARNIVFFREQFMVFIGEDGGGGKPAILSSIDGVKWSNPRPVSTEKDTRVNSLLRRMAVGTDLLVAVGDYGRKSVTRDGIDWKISPGVHPVDTLIDVAFGNGVFVGGGMHGLRMRSLDGYTWTDRAVGEEGEHINAMLFDSKQFVGVGQGATYLSGDGLKWDRIPNENAPTAAAFGAGSFVGSLWPGRLMHSADGIHWTDAARLPRHVRGFAFGVLGTKS